jgi:hypothetical protein
MTTGRINQVTIFDGVRSALASLRPGPREGVGVVIKVWVLEAPGHGRPRGVSPGFAFRPSDCHNWIPQGEVRRGAGGRPLGRRPTKACPPREEVTRRRSRLMKDGYRYADVPPISSWVMIANGQQPTDSLGAGDLVKSSRSSGAAAIQPTGAPRLKRANHGRADWQRQAAHN